MKDVVKTGVCAGAAVALTLLALAVGPRAKSLELFDDEGKLFFADFKDPAVVAELEVIEYRDAPFPFAVKRDDKGRWTIPSHSGYPADAKDRVAKAATLMIGLKKDAVVDDERSRHADYGVLDPLDPSSETKGRGTRMKMKDSAGNVLADLIIGKEVESKPGVHYVRVPEKKRVYRTKLAGEVSTKFADWIETDLLKAQSWEISKVIFDNYTFNEQATTLKEAIVPGEKFTLAKDDAGKWTLAGLDAAKEETNEEKAREIGDTLGQIKIVGVRAKPEGLTAALEQATGRDRKILASYLQPLGYFLLQNGKMYSNEGDLLFETKKGVRYTLRFGELVPGEGEELTAGTSDPNKKPKEGDKPKEGEPKSGNNRYLMVTVEFVEDLIGKPAGARLPKDQLDKRATARTDIEAIQRAVEAYRAKHENKLPESLAKLTEKPADGDAPLKELKKDPWGNDYLLSVQGEGYAVISFADGNAEGGEGAAADVRSDRLPQEDEFKKTADAWTDYDRKVEDGRKEAEKLGRRFGPWYYVIDQTLFGKLKPKRADLVKAKATPPAPAPDATTPHEPGK